MAAEKNHGYLSQFGPPTFQGLTGHMWPVAPVLHSAGLGTLLPPAATKKQCHLQRWKISHWKESFILCWTAPASGVGTFAFISNFGHGASYSQ